MSRVFVHGVGAVSPAGWGTPALNAAIDAGSPLPTSPLARPGLEQPLQVRSVAAPLPRPALLAHPRLRRASPIAQHVVAAALEALGEDASLVANGTLRLGVIVATMAGSVAYSRRFYEEVLRDPSTASPLLFPETVFNAPASHLAAFLGSTEINYSIVGDNGAFLGGLALAAQWLTQGRVDGCIVVGAEELDWVVAEAARLFHATSIHGAGAGALYLKCGVRNAECGIDPRIELTAITDALLFDSEAGRTRAARQMRAQLTTSPKDAALCLSTRDVARLDAAELAAWADWNGPRMSPTVMLGEAFAASAAWQCVAACEALRSGSPPSVNVSVVGINQQAIGASFSRP